MLIGQVVNKHIKLRSIWSDYKKDPVVFWEFFLYGYRFSRYIQQLALKNLMQVSLNIWMAKNSVKEDNIQNKK